MLKHNFRFSADQIHKLLKILLDNNKFSKQKFCCIIFVRERFMTQVIYHILKVSSLYVIYQKLINNNTN